MADHVDSELNINLKALKKVDPYIISIEEHSSNVALYKYVQDSKGGDWQKTEVEGTLFVYKREAEPIYGFTIMNRLSTENLLEPVTRELDFQLQPPFLLYKNHLNVIYGIWFYEKKDSEKVGRKVTQLVQEVEARQQARKAAGGGDLNQILQNAKKKMDVEKPSADTGKNLLRLLSQQDSSSGPPRKSSPENDLKGTSLSVQNFFATAKTDIRTTPHLMPNNSCAFTQVPGEKFSGFPGGGNLQNLHIFGQPVIQALPISQGLAMGAVPVGGFAPYMVPHTQPLIHNEANSLLPIQNLLRSPGVHTVDKLEEEQRKSSSPPQSRSPPPLVGGNLSDLESQLKMKLHINSGKIKEESVREKREHVPQVGAPAGAGRGGTLTLQSRPVGQPTLLSPQVFSSGLGSPPHPVSSTTTNGGGLGAEESSKPSITPLTRQQMTEALEFLLESDPTFIDQLHQAYIQSLSKKFRIVK